jgi:hypothetical protein
MRGKFSNADAPSRGSGRSVHVCRQPPGYALYTRPITTKLNERQKYQQKETSFASQCLNLVIPQLIRKVQGCETVCVCVDRHIRLFLRYHHQMMATFFAILNCTSAYVLPTNKQSTKASSIYKQPAKEVSAHQSRACLPCA